MSVEFKLAERRARKPMKRLLEESREQLAQAFAGWSKLGAVTVDAKATHISAWSDEPHDASKRLQIYGSFKLEIGQDVVSFSALIAEPLATVFSGREFSPQFKQAWYANLAKSINGDAFASNFSQDTATGFLHPRSAIAPWETVRFASVTDTSLTVERFNVLTAQVVSARGYSFELTPGMNEDSAAYVRDSGTGAYTDVSSYLSYCVNALVGTPSANRDLEPMAGSGRGSMKPPEWVRRNLEEGYVREQAERHERVSLHLGTYALPVLAVKGETLALVGGPSTSAAS